MNINPLTLLKKSAFIFNILIFISVNLIAQTGPGGVGNKDGASGQPTNKIWFDASSLSLSNNATVATWDDRSGNANDAYQITATKRPEFRTGQINGLPAVFFNPTGGAGNEDFMPFDGSVIAGSDYSVIFVGQRRSNNLMRIMLGGTNTGANNNLHTYWNNSSQFRAHHYGNDLQTDMLVNTLAYSGGTDVSEYGIFTTRLGSTEANPQRKNYQNNYNLGGLNNTAKLNSWDGAAIGRAILGASEYYSDIDVAEILIYSTAINTAQLQIVHNYLSEKYNITIDADKYSPIATYSHDVSGIGMETNEKHTRASSAGLYVYENSGTLANDEYVFFSHNNTANLTVTTDLPSGVQERWARDWYLDKINTTDVNIKLVFDLPEGIANGKYPGTISDYTLLYRNSTSGNYSELTMTTAVALGDADQIEFTLANGEYSDGYFTLGTTDQTTSPVVGVSGKTWYALTTGDWDNWEIWTLDPSGMLPNNPGNDVPALTDKVVIHSGKKVTVQAVSGIITIAEITVEGKLDLQNLSVHNFTEIRGSGKIMMSGDNFPIGNATHFYTKGQGEGTVRYYGTGYTLATDREFFNIEIMQTNSTNAVIQTSNYTINGNLTVETGIWQINDAATTNLNLEVQGNVSIETNGQILTGIGNARHQFDIYGNLTNNGTVKFTNRVAADYTNEATDGIIDANFLSANSNQTILCNGITNFYRIEIDKGSDMTYELSIEATATANFKLYGYSNQGHNDVDQLDDGAAAAGDRNPNALGLYRGTVRIRSNVEISSINSSGNYNISKAARLWVDGGSVSKLAGTGWAIVPYGEAKITAGTFESYVGSGFTIRGNGAVIVEGGTLNTSQIRTSNMGAGHVGSYIQTGGTANVLGSNSETDYYVFNLTFPGNVFQMAGGTLHIHQAHGKGGIFINSDASNVNVTGGNVICDIDDSEDFIITSRAPFWNVILRKTSTGGHNHILDEGVDVGSTNVSLAAQPLVVLNDLTLEASIDDFISNNENVTVGRNFSIEEGATYDYGTNTTSFNGIEDGELYIGHSTLDDYEQSFYNFTVNKPADKSLTVKGDTEKTAAYIQANNPSRHAWARLVQIKNNLEIKSGILNQGEHAIILFGGIKVDKDGTCGVYEAGTTHLYALIMLRGSVIFETEEGAEFGNLKLNCIDGNTVTMESNLYVKRISYFHGSMDLQTYNLKLDYLHREHTTNNFDVNTDGGGTNRMLYSAGNASDGGLSILVTENGTYGFPIGVVGKYTYAEVIVTNYNNDGYIQIRPVDGELKTTNLAGGDLLDYYWRVGYEDFTTLPTVQYEFKYDDSDILTGDDELNYYPGKVLDGGNYTRSYEQQANVVTNSNTITFNDTGGTSGNTGNGFTLEKANYTAGVAGRFTGQVDQYYAYWEVSGQGAWPNAYSQWNVATTWEKGSIGSGVNEVPITGSVCHIGGRKRVWGETMVNEPAEIKFEHNYTVFPTPNGDNVPRLQFKEPGAFALGRVSGTGMLSFDARDAITITGDIGEFGNNNESYILYFGSGVNTIINIPTPIPNLYLEAGTKRIGEAIKVNNDFILNGSCTIYLENDIDIARDLVVGDYGAGDITFPAAGPAVTVTVGRNIDFTRMSNTDDRDLNVENGGNGSIEHRLILKGSILHSDQNGNDLDFYNGNNRTKVILELQGDGNHEYSRTSTSVPELYRIVMNKGTSQANSFTFSNNFTLGGTTSGANVLKALELQNGTLILDDAVIDINLTTGDDDFSIPASTCLEVKQGIVKASGNNTGIKLGGKLIVSGGTVDMATGIGNGNNYIEYASSGKSELIISSGVLSVGSQIRRQLNSQQGILTYNQSGGTVEVGINAAPENDRGVFEILNTGSSFSHSAGSFTIARQQTNPTIASFYFNPEKAVLSNGTTIKIGNGDTPANQNITAYINKPIKNLLLDNSSSNNLKFTLENVNVELQEDLTILSGTQFDANGLQLTMSGGNFINNGTYTHSENLVLFNSSAAQKIQGSSITTFYQLTKDDKGDLALQNDIIIEDDLIINKGTLADESNEIYLYGDIYNFATHTYGGNGNGISFLGNINQKVYGNNGEYGKISINNLNGVTLDVGTDNIYINNALQLEAGIFDIGENLLTLRTDAIFIDQNPYSSTNMVQTNNSIGDSGIKKYFSAGAGTYLCPIGAAGKYTPVDITTTNNSSTTGSITIKAADEVHPTITEDVEAPDPEITDVDNALQFYWTLIAHDFTDITGTIEMFYDNSDVVTTAPYTNADYITARLLSNGSGMWHHYNWTDFDEVAEKLIFSFNTSVADADISGDYTAGAEPNSANRLGAIPNQVPAYISISDGDWTNIATWDTYPTAGGTIPTGGPDGAMVIIDAPAGVPHTVVMNQNYIEAYTTEIRGILQQKLTFGNRLGILKGTGTLSTEHSSLPAGYYPEFLVETGGTLEYTGTDDYDILGQISELNNLVLSGSGERSFPNIDIQMLGTLAIEGTVQADNDNNRRISVKKDVTYNGGTFDAGTDVAIFEFNGTSPQSILGASSFIGTNAFWNVEMNNTFGLTLSNPLDIDNELIFTTGVIHTTATNIITLESTIETIVSGAGIGKYVDGPLNKKINSGGDFLFPVGNAGRYGIAGLNDVSKTDTWQAEYYNNNPNDDSYDPSVFVAPLKIVSENEYWRIEASAGGTAKIELRWDALNGGFADDAHRSDMRIAEWRDEATDAWYQVDPTNTISGNSSAGIISSNVNSTFNEFTVNPLGNIFTISTVYSIVDFTWDGSASITWEDGLNWSGNVVPSAMDNTIIPDAMPYDPTISSAAACNELTVATNTTVTISAGNSLTTNGDFSNAGILLLETPASNAASASFIDNGTITGTGKIHVERYMEANKFHYVSSPIQAGLTGNATSNLFTTSNPSGNYNPNFYFYDETMDLDGNTGTAPLNPDDNSNTFNSDNLVPGWTYAHNDDGGVTPIGLDEKTGYAFYTDMNQTVTFEGDANTGDFNISGLTYTDNDAQVGPLPNYYDGWNLVSNPYPSSIDWDLIKGTRTELDDGIYVWDGTQYASYSNDVKGGSMNLSNEVAPMQAFFVHSTANNASFQLNNSHRVHSSVNYLKRGDEEENVKPNFIRLKMQANGFSDYSVIYFKSNATNGFDGSFDAFKLYSNVESVPHIYSVTSNDATPLSINALPDNTMDNLIIPLHIKIGQAGTYTISLDEFNFENKHVYFVDNQENLEVYLNEEILTDYSFTCGSGILSDRFELRFFKNNAPVVQDEILVQSVLEDNQFEFTISQNSFIENDLNDEIVSYTAKLATGGDLPTWLNFNNETLTFSGQAINDEVGIVEIQVEVADKMGATASQIFSITVINTNDVPTIINEIPDMEINTSELYTYAIPENTFVDVDLGDIITYSANLEDGNLLPEWLLFNTETNTFTGTPTIAEILNIEVTANDIAGTYVSDVFELTVKGTSNISNVNNFEIKIYPNPAKDFIIIHLFSLEEKKSVKIIDISGKLMFEKNITSMKTEIDISNFSQGIFFVKVQNGSQVIVTKIIKQ